MKIPEGTQSGKQFKVRNKGMPVLRSRDVGDLYIQVTVETPQNLTKRQRELLAEFDSLLEHDASGSLRLFRQDERFFRKSWAIRLNTKPPHPSDQSLAAFSFA